MRSLRSTVSRSAEPLPCAIQVPEHARITGSIAVTRPLAGCCSRMPSAVRTWMYGSRFDDDDHVVAVKLAAERRAQRLLVPDALAAVERPVLALEVADQLAYVARDRPQLGRRRCPRRAQDPLAAQQRAQALHPAAPRELRDDDGDQRDRRAQRDEEVEEITSRLLASPRDEAHVVDEHELRARHAVGCRPAARRRAAGRAASAAPAGAVGIGIAASDAQLISRGKFARGDRLRAGSCTGRRRRGARPAAAG